MSDTPKYFMDDREFYELMQIYRHQPLMPPELVVKAFEDVKAHIRLHFRERNPLELATLLPTCSGQSDPRWQAAGLRNAARAGDFDAEFVGDYFDKKDETEDVEWAQDTLKTR